MITYANFLQLISQFKLDIDEYVLREDQVNDSYYIAKMWIENAALKAVSNVDYRTRLAEYIRKGSTLELRNLMCEVGCDYWGNIAHSNACDMIDSAMSSTCSYGFKVTSMQNNHTIGTGSFRTSKPLSSTDQIDFFHQYTNGCYLNKASFINIDIFKSKA